MVGKASRVQAVRQRGGDCVEVVKGRVRVEKEGGPMNRVLEEDYQEWEMERIRGMEDKRAVAEVRGKEAEQKLAREFWLQERIKKAEIERRESVKLMEMLRSVKMMTNPKVNHHNIKDNIGVVESVRNEFPGEENTVEIDDNVERRTIVSSGKQKRSVSQKGTSAVVTGLCKEWRDSSKQVEEETDTGQERNVYNVARGCRINMIRLDKSNQSLDTGSKDKQKELVKLVSPLGELDSTEEVSCLSTIIEETENLSLSPKDKVDFVKDAGRLLLEDSKESSVSPFPESNIQRKKEAETDLTSVKQLMARVKMQGKVLEKSDTHFMTVEGRARGKETSNSTILKPYKIDQQFVKRVLEFSSSSGVCSSSSQSSSISTTERISEISLQPAKFLRSDIPQTLSKQIKNSKTVSKPKKMRIPTLKVQNVPQQENVRPAKLPASQYDEPDQPQLRYYIEKLLNLRQEDIQNLSVSSCTTPEGPVETRIRKIPPPSSFSLSSTRSTMRKAPAEDSRAIQSLYYSTRQQLMSKLSSVTGANNNVQGRSQLVEWSSFDLSSGEGGDDSSGTITSIHLSTTEYDTW